MKLQVITLMSMLYAAVFTSMPSHKPPPHYEATVPFIGQSSFEDIRPVETAMSDTEQYIFNYAPTAQMQMRRYGVPASIALGQAILESKAGTSQLALQCANHFGMRNGSRGYQKFKNARECWYQYALLLSSGRYQQLHRYGTDYKAWARGLQNCHYASGKDYATRLIGVIECFNLDRFDNTVHF